MDHQRIARAAGRVGHGLPVAVWRVGGLCPTIGIVGKGLRAAELVEVPNQLGKPGFIAFSDRIGECVYGFADRATAHISAVVAGDEHDDGVVVQALVFQVRDEAADLMIGVLEEARIDLHESCIHALLVHREAVPGRNTRVARGQLCVGGNDAEFLLAGEGLLAINVPTLVEAALVSVDPLAVHLQGLVGRAGRKEHEERLVGVQLLLAIDVEDRLVGQLSGQVPPVRLDVQVVLDERRRVLVDGPAQEAQPMVKALAGGPAIERPQFGGLVVRHQMPLAQHVGAVATGAQVVGDGAVLGLQAPGVARELCGHQLLRQQAHADHVVVAPGQQRRSRGRAHCRGVEVRVGQPVLGQRIERRGARPAAKGAGRAVAHVVEQDPDDVRCALGDRHLRSLARLRLGEALADHRCVALRCGAGTDGNQRAPEYSKDES